MFAVVADQAIASEALAGIDCPPEGELGVLVHNERGPKAAPGLHEFTTAAEERLPASG